ncbi:class A beta-lactamase-related serine hydrolase [Brevibacillus fluminis]|uniref:Class A beta-lactamase-related serine hydrolase n=1 Tax=Brevibacillus fluminis TaxID=511487 RepID=A0A3M8DSU4_9BACL|nr:serine hydrolase domain-containing protein [Brevibacillus fluminis]RNB91228.1 class A beta-lactamase-related serine hydrolase [Brevibacillus fluminis]
MGTHVWEKPFEAYAQKLIDEVQVPGAIVAVAKDGELIYEKSFGYRDREEQAPIDLDTVFGIGSITKSYTCVAIMQLQEAGKLSIHDPVVKYLPEFRTPDESHTKAITIQHFMTHTLGLPPLSSLFPGMLESMKDDPAAEELLALPELQGLEPIHTYEQLMDYIAKQPIELLGAPGSEFSYSNDAYALLGAIIERASGQPYEDYVKEHILEPLGLTRSVFHIEELGDDLNHSMLYSAVTKDGVKEVLRTPIWWDAPAMRAAGFLKASARDMLRYADVYRTGGSANGVRILSGASVAEMVTPIVKVDALKGYGYGLGIQPFGENATLIQHTGGIKGVTAHLLIVPEAGITGILLTSISDSPIQALTLGLLNSLLGRPLETPYATVDSYEAPLDVLRQSVGTFKSGEGDQVTVKFDEENERLVLAMGGKELPLRPIGEDAYLFTERNVDTSVRFVRSADGTIIRFALGSRQLPVA